RRLRPASEAVYVKLIGAKPPDSRTFAIIPKSQQGYVRNVGVEYAFYPSTVVGARPSGASGRRQVGVDEGPLPVHERHRGNAAMLCHPAGVSEPPLQNNTAASREVHSSPA